MCVSVVALLSPVALFVSILLFCFLFLSLTRTVNISFHVYSTMNRCISFLYIFLKHNF